jgi:hypothetical protein
MRLELQMGKHTLWFRYSTHTHTYFYDMRSWFISAETEISGPTNNVLSNLKYRVYTCHMLIINILLKYSARYWPKLA